MDTAMLGEYHVREAGQGLVEYAMILGLVAVALIAALMLMADPVNGIFGNIVRALVNAGT